MRSAGLKYDTEVWREQWPRLDGAILQKTARDLGRDETLRVMGPRQAVAKWLRRGIPGRPDAAAVAPADHLCRSAAALSEAR